MSHPILDALRDAVVHYGYWAVGGILLLENAGIPLPGETVLLLASFLAYSQHELQLGWIMVVATIASTLGDNLGYAFGQYGGRPLLERYRSLFRLKEAAIMRGEKLFARYGALTIFFARFVFGMRIIAGPLAGVLRMPWRRFFLFNFLGAVVWVVVISGTGYLFGRHWSRLEHVLGRLDLALVVLAIFVILFLYRRSRRENRGGPFQ